MYDTQAESVMLIVRMKIDKKRLIKYCVHLIDENHSDSERLEKEKTGTLLNLAKKHTHNKSLAKTQ